MEQNVVGSQIRNDQGGGRRGDDAQSEHSPSHNRREEEISLPGTTATEDGTRKTMNLKVEEESRCSSPSGISSGSRTPCTIDANDLRHTGKGDIGSVEAPQQFGSFLDFLRVPSTRWTKRRWSSASSKNFRSDKDWSYYYKPVHTQLSLPEGVPRLTNRGAYTSISYSKDGSAKVYRRSRTFPLERKDLPDPSAGTTSLGSLTTVSCSSAASSLFPFFTREHTNLTSLFRSGEVERLPTEGRRQDCSNVFGTSHRSAHEKPGASADEDSLRNLRLSSLISGGVDSRLSGLKSLNLVDDKHNIAPIRKFFSSIQRSFECGRAGGCSLAPPGCDGFHVCGRRFSFSSSSSQSKYSPEALSATTSDLLHESTGTVPHVTKSPSPSCSHTASSPRSGGFTKSSSGSRFERGNPLEACTDRMCTEIGEAASSCVEPQHAANSESCVTLRYASASLYSPIPPEGEITELERSFEGDCGSQRLCVCVEHGKGITTDFEQEASLVAGTRLEASPEAEENHCPDAPLLTCALPPCSQIPEFELDARMLDSGTGTQDSFTDLEQAEKIAGSHATGALSPQLAQDELFEPGRTLHEVTPILQSTAVYSSILQTSFSGPLQQALRATAFPGEERTCFTVVAKHSPIGL